MKILKSVIYIFCLSSVSFVQVSGQAESFQYNTKCTIVQCFNCTVIDSVAQGDLEGESLLEVKANDCGPVTLRLRYQFDWEQSLTINWIHGLSFKSGPEWTISPVSIPEGWMFDMDGVVGCCSGNYYGTGFYVDSNNITSNPDTLTLNFFSVGMCTSTYMKIPSLACDGICNNNQCVYLQISGNCQNNGDTLCNFYNSIDPDAGFPSGLVGDGNAGNNWGLDCSTNCPDFFVDFTYNPDKSTLPSINDYLSFITSGDGSSGCFCIDNSTDSENGFVIKIHNLQDQPKDYCGDAEEINVLPEDLCVDIFFSASNSCSSPETGFSTPLGCYFDTEETSWYIFTAPGTIGDSIMMNFEMNGFSGSGVPFMGIFKDSCSGLTAIGPGCFTGANIHFENIGPLIAGQKYYIAFSSLGDFGGNSDVTLAFRAGPPDNKTCYQLIEPCSSLEENSCKCYTAPVISNLLQLDGYNFRTNSYYHPNDGPTPLCPNAIDGPSDNPTWISFVAPCPEFGIDIFFHNCSGKLESRGLQAAIYSDCSNLPNSIVQGGCSVDINPNPCNNPDCQGCGVENGFRHMDISGLQTGGIYHLLLDGCGGSSCIVKFAIDLPDNCDEVVSTGISHSSVKVYPSPASDFIYVESSEAQIEKIEIFSLQGISVLSTTEILGSKKELSVGHLSPGLYLIKWVNRSTQLVGWSYIVLNTY